LVHCRGSGPGGLGPRAVLANGETGMSRLYHWLADASLVTVFPSSRAEGAIDSVIASATAHE